MTLTLNIYKSLGNGITVSQAETLIGDPGSLLSSETAQIEPGLTLLEQQTEIYEWSDEGNRSIRLMFVRGLLHDKTQHGLEQ